MAAKWWETHCPICGETETVEMIMQVHEDAIHECSGCKFQWSTELPEHVLILLAAGHIRKGINESTDEG